MGSLDSHNSQTQVIRTKAAGRGGARASTLTAFGAPKQRLPRLNNHDYYDHDHERSGVGDARSDSLIRTRQSHEVKESPRLAEERDGRSRWIGPLAGGGAVGRAPAVRVSYSVQGLEVHIH